MLPPTAFPLDPPSSSSPPVLDEDGRKRAFLRTAHVLRELDQIRRTLEMPPAALEHVLAVYVSSAREVALEREQAALAARTLRAPMTMSSGIRIVPGQTAQINELPQWESYRVEEIKIHGDPSRWRVFDIKVGNRPQSPTLFLRPIPGECFRKGGIMSELRLETCQRAMYFSLTIEYVGPVPEGEIFEATIVGTAVS